MYELKTVGRLRNRKRRRQKDTPHRLGHPLQRKQGRDVLHPGGQLGVDEVHTRSELKEQDEGSRQSAGGSTVLSECRKGDAQQGARDEAQGTNPEKSEPKIQSGWCAMRRSRGFLL